MTNAVALAFVLLTLLAPAGEAQRAAATRGQAPRTKGVWEPVNYPADIAFNDVFFVSPEVGWATSGRHGQGGMLLRTTSAGSDWEVQLGDYQASEPQYHHLYFIHAKLGWVLQDLAPLKWKLLRTTDGESWGQVGVIDAGWGLRDYTFLSRDVGLYVNGNDNAAQIMRTTNGGRTWREVFRCRARVEIQGLTRDIDCSLNAMHFPTAAVGYAIGVEGPILLVAKTTDAGATWRLHQVELGGEPGYDLEDLVFLDENTGIARLPGNRIYRTTDGGETWVGAVGTPGAVLRFADPEVGWSFSGSRTLVYTTDGGRRWLARPQPFPAGVTAFSVPRRDRAFVVGEHGMAWRYRVVPVSEPSPAKAVEAPAMPVLESELDDEVESLEEDLDAIEKAVDAADDSAGASAAGDTVSFVDACCAKRVGELQATIDALSPLLQRFAGRYRNVNLVLAGLQLLGVMPDQLAGVREKMQALRRARGPAAAATALAEVTAALDALKQSTRYAFQQEASVVGGDDVALPAGAPATESDRAGSADARQRPAEARADDDGAKKAAEEAKKRAQDALRKRVRIRIP